MYIFKENFIISGREINCQDDLDRVYLNSSNDYVRKLIKDGKIVADEQTEKAIKSPKNKSLYSIDTK